MEEVFSPNRPERPPFGVEPRPWCGWWVVVGLAVACLPISAAALFMAEFGGRSYWRDYVVAGLVWALPLGGLSLARSGLGSASRRLACVLAASGVGYLLLGLPGFLRDPGWQF